MADPHILAERIHQLGELERTVLTRLLKREISVPNTNVTFDSRMTFGQRAADRIATFGGSWTFILLFLGGLAIWVLINGRDPKTFDPYPFIFLNLILSMLAALQAPVIM